MRLKEKQHRWKEHGNDLKLKSLYKAEGLKHPFVVLYAIDDIMRHWQPPYLHMKRFNFLNPILEGKYKDKRLTREFFKKEMEKRHKFKINARTVVREEMYYHHDPLLFLIDGKVEYQKTRKKDELVFSMKSRINDKYLKKDRDELIDSVDKLVEDIYKIPFELDDPKKHCHYPEITEQGLHYFNRKGIKRKVFRKCKPEKIDKLETKLCMGIHKLIYHIECNGLDELSDTESFVETITEECVEIILPEIECGLMGAAITEGVGPIAGILTFFALAGGVYYLPSISNNLPKVLRDIVDLSYKSTVVDTEENIPYKIRFPKPYRKKKKFQWPTLV